MEMKFNPHALENKIKNRCLVNKGGKYLFIPISKNASTSIRNHLIWDDLMFYDDIKDSQSFFKFTIWRNPLERIISSYSELCRLRKDGPHQITLASGWYKEKNRIKSFEKFVDFIKDNFYDGHVFPQIIFLKHKGLTIKDVNVVLSMDSLKKDYSKMLNQFPQIQFKKGGLLKKQVSILGRDHQRLHSYIQASPMLKGKIIDLYKEDWEIYCHVKKKIKYL